MDYKVFGRGWMHWRGDDDDFCVMSNFWTADYANAVLSTYLFLSAMLLSSGNWRIKHWILRKGRGFGQTLCPTTIESGQPYFSTVRNLITSPKWNVCSPRKLFEYSLSILKSPNCTIYIVRTFQTVHYYFEILNAT